ncbi:MAG: hypothetical protein ICV76_07720 [Nitrospiraceae bacterium]|nr:hypothetical protein [Nitrospiraceae bacterium]
MKHQLTDESKHFRDEFLSVMVKLHREGKEENNEEKTNIAECLAMLAGAIQEGQTESLAHAMNQWGKVTLENWKTK